MKLFSNKILLFILKKFNHFTHFKVFSILNCITYAVAVAWLICTGKAKKHPDQGQQRGNGSATREPSWKRDLENDVKGLRKQISIATSELERIKRKGKTTKKGKKNRKYLQEQGVKISSTSLTNFIEGKKAEIRRTAKRRRWKDQQDRSRKWNRKFKAQPNVIYSQFKKSTQGPQEQSFESITDAEEFWRPMLEEEGTGNPEAEWLKDVAQAMEEAVPEQEVGKINVTEETITEVLKKKKSWYALGPDGICNYWLKKITTLHKPMADASQELLISQEQLPNWLSAGRTTLIPKEGEWSRANYRPTTCMNTVYKAITTTLFNPVNQHLEEHQLIQRDQRGACEGSNGTLDNLLIDKTVLEDARDHRRNMACAWVDVHKAYDSVDHNLLRVVLQMHKFPVTLINAIMKVVKGTSTRLIADTNTGKESSSPTHLKKALLQGDSLCPILFAIYLNHLHGR